MSRALRSLPLFGFLSLCALSCSTLAHHPAIHEAYWESYSSAGTLSERVYPAPEELVDFLRLDNRKNGFPEVPAAISVPTEFLSDLKSAIAELPERLVAHVQEKLIGIFLVGHLGGTGFTDIVRDDKERVSRLLIVLDPEALERNANEWLSWKESSPFQPEEGITLEGRLEQAPLNTRKSAIQFILLHELGHVLGTVSGVHPEWTKKPKEVLGSLGDFAFVDFSWTVRDGKFALRDPAWLPAKAKLAYYSLSHRRLAASEMLGTYRDLSKTCFPTLYSATNPYDDFAESVAVYAHTRLLGRPYEIHLKKNGRDELVYRPDFGRAACHEKFEILEKLLSGP